MLICPWNRHAIIGRGERGHLSIDAWTVKGQKLGLITTAVVLFFISKPSARRVRPLTPVTGYVTGLEITSGFDRSCIMASHGEYSHLVALVVDQSLSLMIARVSCRTILL